MSEAVQGSPERILHVTGPLDAVSKVSETSRILPLMFSAVNSVHSPGLRFDRQEDQRRALRHT